MTGFNKRFQQGSAVDKIARIIAVVAVLISAASVAITFLVK